MRATLVFWVLLILMSSCEPEEALYPPPLKLEGLQTKMLDMGEDRDRDVFVHLGSNSDVQTTGSLWDLGFACANARWEIILNTGNDAWVYQGDTGAIPNNLNVPLEGWRYDHPSGNPEETGIGKWSPDGVRSFGYWYILDRGMNMPAAARYVKFKIEGTENGAYLLLYAGLKDSNFQKARIARRQGKNYSYFSFAINDTLQAEPLDKDAWDLVFRKYKSSIIETGTGKPFDYVAVGCLLNPWNTSCVEVSGNVPFEKVDRNLALSLNFSNKLDVIGYDWKLFDRLSGKYTVSYNRVFVIRTSNDGYFKLRFTDYYNDFGQRGYPKFEFEQL